MTHSFRLFRPILACALLAGCNTRAPMPPLVVAPSVVVAVRPEALLTVVGSSVDRANGICRVHDLSATFDMPMDPASIDERRFVLSDDGVRVPGRVALDGTGRTVRFTPADPAGFPPSHTIVAALLSGDAGVRGRGGQVLERDRVWVFSTGWERCDGKGVMLPAARAAAPVVDGTVPPR